MPLRHRVVVFKLVIIVIVEEITGNWMPDHRKWKSCTHSKAIT